MRTLYLSKGQPKLVPKRMRVLHGAVGFRGRERVHGLITTAAWKVPLGKSLGEKLTRPYPPDRISAIWKSNFSIFVNTLVAGSGYRYSASWIRKEAGLHIQFPEARINADLRMEAPQKFFTPSRYSCRVPSTFMKKNIIYILRRLSVPAVILDASICAIQKVIALLLCTSAGFICLWSPWPFWPPSVVSSVPPQISLAGKSTLSRGRITSGGAPKWHRSITEPGEGMLDPIQGWERTFLHYRYYHEIKH